MACTDTNDISEEYELPAVEAVLAGTLALMTGFAEAERPAHREQMTYRIVCNLALLADHPQLSVQFRCAVGKLRRHWQHLQEHGPDGASTRDVRHPAAGLLQ